MPRVTRHWFVAVMLMSVLLRVGVAFYLGDTVPPTSDEMSYSSLAVRLISGHGYSFDRGWYPFTPANAPTSHWSFLYTAFVAAVYFFAGPHPLAARLVQSVLAGVLLPWLTYRLARRVGIGEATALGAALLSAIYAYFVLYGAMVQTEALYICSLLWSLERSVRLADTLRQPPSQLSAAQARTDAVTLGLSLGVATLLRQSILPWAAVTLVWLLVDRLWKGERHWQRLAPPAAAGAVMLACILPFTVRNYLAFDGSNLLLNSNAGYAMYSAQHPMHGSSFQEYAAAPLPEELAGSGLNEAQWDKELMRRGIGFILAEPRRYLLLSLSRVRDYFEFWPTTDSSLLFNVGRVSSIGLFLPFMLYGGWVATRYERRKKAEGWRPAGPRVSGVWLLLIFMAFYSVMHILTWAMSRYRLPVDAVALIFAAVGFADLAQRLGVVNRPTRLDGGA